MSVIQRGGGVGGKGEAGRLVWPPRGQATVESTETRREEALGKALFVKSAVF